MSSPSNPPFECRWQASRLLLALYLSVLGCAVWGLLLLPVPLWLRCLGLLFCLAHAGWAVPRHILLSSDGAWRGLRHDESGWSLWSRREGWQPIQLRPDSLALPVAVILRFRRPGQWFPRGVCVPRGALPVDEHRRLRVRLKFSRDRWAAPG